MALDIFSPPQWAGNIPPRNRATRHSLRIQPKDYNQLAPSDRVNDTTRKEGDLTLVGRLNAQGKRKNMETGCYSRLNSIPNSSPQTLVHF